MANTSNYEVEKAGFQTQEEEGIPPFDKGADVENKSEYRVLHGVGGDKTPQSPKATAREFSNDEVANMTVTGINPMK